MSNFNSYSDRANKLINKNGEVTLLNGEPVDLQNAVDKYKSMSPMKDSLLQPDGSTIKFSDLFLGGGYKIVKNKNLAFFTDTPVVGSPTDTGYEVTDGDTTKELLLSLIVSGGGNNYALFSRFDVELGLQQTDIRVARGTELEGVSGDVNFLYWIDGATGNIFYEIDFDGGEKTAESISIYETTLSLETV